MAALSVAVWQADLAYQHLTEGTPTPAGMIDAASAPDDTAERRDNSSQAQALRLGIFGEDRAAEVPTAVPETENTDYHLQGLSVNRQGDRFAIIQTGDGVGIFRPGDTLPGGERVGEISVALVVLRSDDGDSTLRFEDQAVARSSKGGPGNVKVVEEVPMESDPELKPRRVMSAEPEIPPRLNIEKPAVALGQLRTALIGNSAIKDIHFRRTRAYDGRTGWRLRWAKDPRVAELFGLQRGDVLIEVNGIAIDEVRDFSSVAPRLATVQEIILDVQRGDGPARIVIPIDAI